jgi:hypothetical protein
MFRLGTAWKAGAIFPACERTLKVERSDSRQVLVSCRGVDVFADDSGVT